MTFEQTEFRTSRGSDFLLGGRPVGNRFSPTVIAELSGNHNQSLDRALQIVDAAAKSGAHALKLQTYTADTITIDCREREFFIAEEDNLWKGKSLFDLYRQAHTPWEWHVPIMERARKRGLVCFSTPFDESAVDFLETLDVPAYKIASFEVVHLPLVRKVAMTGKPIIMSTGMATLAEIEDAVRVARDAGCRHLALLKCTSTYPSSSEDSNVRTIPLLGRLFDCEVGLSDHTMGIGAAVAAVALGATIIEKHFTLRRSDGGIDSAFSMEPDEMSLLVRETQTAWQALGRARFGPTEAEKPSLRYRRSIYVVKEIKAGGMLTAENVRIIRPGLGLAPKFLEEIVGRTVKCDVQPGTPMDWKYLG